MQKHKIPALHEQPSSYLHPSKQHKSCFDGHCTLTADRSTAGALGAGAGSGAGAGAAAGAGAGSAFLAGALGSFFGAISANSRATLSLEHRQFPVRVTTQGVYHRVEETQSKRSPFGRIYMRLFSS